ncbi:MAG TPA: NAD-dependent succinate-semialdehyde dehydrogenase [Tepidisphaeraceae bacterium]|nr:NAD-dependent succinate-semialdehyde dehydrogenase [Tepidisphaeraceae bacterium]
MSELNLISDPRGYVDGRWIEASSGEMFQVRNPATGELLASVPKLGSSETVEAIESAERAFRSPMSFDDRVRLVKSISKLLLGNKDQLARIITMEQGKPLKESLVEVEYSAGFFDEASEQLLKLQPHTLSKRPRDLAWTIHHRPAGVAALITPWNFPLAQLAKKVSAALACGCPIVVKPAELTPLSAIALVRLIESIGVPRGWVNLLIGDAESIGAVFCTHPAVRVVSFTGSTRVGRLLNEQASKHLKRMTLELGGSAPFIVFEDANLELTTDALIASKFRCAGQTCVCASRVLVDETISEKLVELVVARVKKLRVGNGLESNVDLGPLISSSGYDKVASHVRDAINRGAKIVVGDASFGPSKSFGNFFNPTVLIDVNESMLVSREETFGPVISIRNVRDESEAIRLANDTPYGLAAYLFTSNVDRAERVVEQLRFGHVGVNNGSGPTPEAPFGGMKDSGFGREGGLEGLLEFCETQTVASKL